MSIHNSVRCYEVPDARMIGTRVIGELNPCWAARESGVTDAQGSRTRRMWRRGWGSGSQSTVSGPAALASPRNRTSTRNARSRMSSLMFYIRNSGSGEQPPVGFFFSSKEITFFFSGNKNIHKSREEYNKHRLQQLSVFC